MSFPATAKTWQFKVNQTILTQATQTIQAQVLMLAIKNSLIGFGSNPWVVRYSCDSVTAGTAGDGVDRWSTFAKLVFNSPGSAHAWMVLRQVGMATNTEILLSLDGNSSGNTLTISISWTAGFTGGTTTASPTATDSTALISNATSWYSNVATQHQLHVWQSTDGQCTRLIVIRGGNNLCTFWQFDRVQTPSSGWATPMIAQVLTATTTMATAYTVIQGGSGVTLNCIASVGGTHFVAGMTYETYANLSTGLVQAVGVGTAANSIDGNWPVMPIGVAANAAGANGRLGNIYDMWWSPQGVLAGQTFPNSATGRQFASFGQLILPWTGGADIPLIA